MDLFLTTGDEFLPNPPSGRPKTTLSTCQETKNEIPTLPRRRSDERKRGSAPAPARGGENFFAGLVASLVL